MRQESHNHHYVSQFLLKPWTVDGVMNGYWWDNRQSRLACKRKGTKAFCKEIDLLTLEGQDEGSDAFERIFFGEIDSKGAIARHRLLKDGPEALDNDGRCDFARLLMSLEARRQTIVHQLRGEGAQSLAEAIDNDPEILSEMEKEGLFYNPSTYASQHGTSFTNRALSLIQKLTDNPNIGGKLINFHWQVIHFSQWDGTLVLADRPLVRINGYDHPYEVWFLPLNPKAVFCAARNITGIDKITPRRLAKLLNVASVEQTGKFVFCVDKSHMKLMEKYLYI